MEKAATTFFLRPSLWFAAFIAWALVMTVASSFSVNAPPTGFEIPHLDKLFHFSYFSLGGALLLTSILLKHGTHTRSTLRFLLPLLLLSLLGAADEFHQSFTPGRSGNDFGDWLADTLGGAFGVFLANRFHPFLRSAASLGR